MKIRLAQENELAIIEEIYANARHFMRQHGNMHQWANGWPVHEVLCEDIAAQRLYVCEENNDILAVFAYTIGADPTYRVIDGQWLNDAPYGVIHRIASAMKIKGAASACFAWALQQCDNLRIDTHADNIPMQNLLKKEGFSYCGIITIADGTLRNAYQKIHIKNYNNKNSRA